MKTIIAPYDSRIFWTEHPLHDSLDKPLSAIYIAVNFPCFYAARRVTVWNPADVLAILKPYHFPRPSRDRTWLLVDKIRHNYIVEYR